MAGGVDQDGTLIFSDDQFIEKASSSENMRLFINKADKLAYLKKFDGSIIPFPTSTPSSVTNVKNIYINASNTQPGNGSLLNPFSSIRDAVASIPNNFGEAYNLLLSPGNYIDNIALDLPTNATINFIAQGGDMLNTIIDFHINWTPNGYVSQSIQFNGITLNQALTIDASTVQFQSFLRFDNSSIKLIIENNTIGDGLNVFAFNSNLVYISMDGSLFTFNCNLIDVVIIEVNGKYFSIGSIIFPDSTGILLKGNAVLNTIGTLKNGNQPYINGETDGVDIPRWSTDNISNTNYSGNLKKLNVDNVAKQTTGLELDFSEFKYYGTILVPETGENITTNMDKVFGVPLGMKQIVIHSSDVEPSYGPQFKKSSESGTYVNEGMNYIEFTFIDEQNILYSIQNILS